MTHVKTSLQKMDSKVWGYHFHIPSSIGNLFVDGNNRRVVYQINNSIKNQGALMPYPEGYFLLVNQELVNKLNLSIGEEVALTIEKDTSEFGLPMPDSFSALLEQDTEGNAYFDKLTPGKKRNLIYIVGKVKNIESQLNKGLAILHHLKLEGGHLDFKKLNQLIKEYNQRSKMK